MGREALRYKQFHAAVIFFELMYKKLQELQSNEDIDIKPHLFEDRKIDLHKASSLLAKTIRLHDETLLQNGEIGLTHRCMKNTFQQNATYANISLGEYINIPELVGRFVFNNYLKENNISRINDTDIKLGSLRQEDKLCAGSKSQVKLNTSLK